MRASFFYFKYLKWLIIAIIGFQVQRKKVKTLHSRLEGTSHLWGSAKIVIYQPISAILTPAILMEPDSMLTNLYNATVRLDFPAPVRPTIPTFSRPLIFTVTFFSANGKFSLYRNCKDKEIFE